MAIPLPQNPNDEATEKQSANVNDQNDTHTPSDQPADEIQFNPVDLSDFSRLPSYKPQVASVKTDMSEVQELAEELADDMLRLMEWVKRLDARQEQLYEQLGSVQQMLEENKKQAAIDMSQLRQELLGERKAMAVRGAFNAIAPMLDALRAMRKALDDTPENNTVRTQLNTVVSALSNIIQSLGYIEFQAEVGMPFDPFQMECLGYGEGELNTVIETVRTGYKTENMIIRPCGVVIAQTSKANNSQP